MEEIWELILLKAGGEADDRGWDGWAASLRGWDGWAASLTQWTWVWASSGSWWWTGRPFVLQSMGSKRVGHDWATELNWIPIKIGLCHLSPDQGKTEALQILDWLDFEAERIFREKKNFSLWSKGQLDRKYDNYIFLSIYKLVNWQRRVNKLHLCMEIFSLLSQ